MFPPAIDIIPTLLAVAYSIGKYTNKKMMSHHVTYSPIPRQFSSFRWPPYCTSSGCLHKNYVADYFPRCCDGRRPIHQWINSSGSVSTKNWAVCVSDCVYLDIAKWASPSGIHACFKLRMGAPLFALSKLKSYKLYMNLGSPFNLLIFACFALGIGYFKTLRRTASER